MTTTAIQSPLAIRLFPNRWDVVVFPLVIGLLVLASTSFRDTLVPLSTLATQNVSLDWRELPEYALRTTLRMLAAMAASLFFTLTYATLAAKSARAERILVPALDILQSVPVLGYISFTVTFFMSLFPGRVIGAECAAIFAIFTSQAWNMAFSFYQSLRTVPRDLIEVSENFQFTGWQRFWKLEVPFAVPGLIWNMMMSMSGGWFFVVASEAITVGNNTVVLPGIGSYLARAIDVRDLHAVGYVIIAMTLVIIAYDQLLFRPLVAFADKFRIENTASAVAPQSWLLNLTRRTSLMIVLLSPLGHGFLAMTRWPLRFPKLDVARAARRVPSVWKDRVWNTLLVTLSLYLLYRIITFVGASVTLGDVEMVLGLGGITLMRVLVLIALASIVWVPLGVLIGLRPPIAEKIQPLAQFLAAFPANLLFPVFVVAIVRWHGNPDIWLSPLIILGTQWYILFNVVAGASAYPNDFREAAANFHIRGWQWWRSAMLPGIFPYYVTGAITASGGAWNASIVAESVQWGTTHLNAHGLGAYIAQTTAAGDYPHIILGISVMSLYVVVFNRLLWRPLYAFAAGRMRAD